MDNFILCGMQFGDEGKGTFVDYLTHEEDIGCIVRYNGGSQASHTVVTPSNTVHKFSQLGSGMFSKKCHTYITENMVINLENLLTELEVFSKKTGISISDLMNRIHIHENCFVVTPYHKLLNKLRELSKGSNRRGSVGTGVSEVRYLLDEPKTFPYELPLGLRVKDIFYPYSNNLIMSRLNAIYNYVSKFYFENKDAIWENTPLNMVDSLNKEIRFLLAPNGFFDISAMYTSNFKYAKRNVNFSKCIYSSYELSFKKDWVRAIFEGSQGLLLDKNYGIKPNTTFLDTTNHFADTICHKADNVTKVGIAKAFTSRHGLGVFPTESDELNINIHDENQEESYWNGKIRFGWFDAVLFRYAQSINKVDELYLSSLDKLDQFETIQVCNEYYYTGAVDETFKKLFSYYTLIDGKILITDIKTPSDELGKYLNLCIPKYILVKGWHSDLSNISDINGLPSQCLDYIYFLQSIIGVPITLVSVGPTRENKIRMCVK